MAGRAPRPWVVAGPNGAGKSTIVAARMAGRLPVVNPDDIAREAGDGNPAAAGRAAVAERRALLEAGTSFGVETTMSEARALRKLAFRKASPKHRNPG